MEPSIYSITHTHQGWPALLRELPPKAVPAALHIKGALPSPDTLIVGIVGSRNPTRYGKDMTEEIARALARRGIVIASGMARGVDTIAHRAALDVGTPTIAVLGSGLSEKVIYPKDNIGLSREIATKNGAVISEYGADQKPELWTFPQRNRIIAGIAKAVIVTEAGEKSGALITARYALEYGRDVLALPGQMTSPLSRGTNALIKEGAIPIVSIDSIFEALGIEISSEIKNTMAYSPDEQTILEHLTEELSTDEIIKRTRLAPQVVLASTASLEIEGMIKQTGGVWRKLI
ncbi:MAG: DNA-protecting protein DprA [Candidatus Ryanbacteria bacterium]|nr:DNA-protecting protein DprA [Candidatus Ryanbacteria bacterium]